MYKIIISVTVSKTDIANQFKGKITFKSGNKVTLFDYLYIDPDGKKINLKFSNENGEFGVDGIPSKELCEGISSNQKLILAMSFYALTSAISRTEMLIMFDGDIPEEMNSFIKVEGKEYLCLFGN